MPAQGETMSIVQRTELDVAVVGGGIVGLFTAWRARERGLSVRVLDGGDEDGVAWPVAAGMLAPISEAQFGEYGARALALGLAAARRWPSAARELGEAGGIDPGLRAAGTLVLARDRDEAEELAREATFRESLGLPVTRLLPSEARRREPALAPALRAALDVPDDHSVDPRRVVAGLRALLGDAITGGARATAVEGDAVHLESGEVVGARSVVVAAGAWTAALVDVPVRPLKGQVLRLRDPAGPGLLSHTLRFSHVYVVPRGDGRYVVGATMEERGFDTAVTAGGVYELLRDAGELVPGIAELELEETLAGLRPATPDSLPVIGRRGDVIVASGHGRDGVLLAPITADLVADLLTGTGAAGPGDADAAALLRACDPDRFDRAEVPAAS
jgi:glycine oxidase